MTTVTWEPVRSRRDIDAFCVVPARCGANGGVPELRSLVTAIANGRHPTLAHGSATLWVGRNPSGDPVARLSTHHDERMDAKLGAPTQLFGLLAYPDDRAIADACFDLVTGEAQAAGRTQMFGTASLLPNQNGGVVTSNFDAPGFLDGPWNAAHVPEDLGRAGFTARFPSATYLCEHLDAPERDPDTVFPFPAERIVEDDLRVRALHRIRFEVERERLLALLNASFEQLGYFTPISAPELRHQMRGVSLLADPNLFLFLERRGTPVAFMLVVPDLSDPIRACAGRPGFGDQLRALAHARRTNRAILIIKGTTPEAQGRGYMRLLSHHLLRNLRNGGYDTLRSTWVEDSNTASAAQFLAMGGRPYQQVAFFSRTVGP